MLMGSCLSVFVRNDGSPALSSVGMCAGAAANILLDWLFIFPLQTGVVGAAIASGLGQVLTVLILLTHFLRRKGNLRIQRLRPNGALIRKVCRRGVPEAATQLTTPVTALCYNLMLARLIGDIGVSTFSVLSFIYSLANAIAVCRWLSVRRPSGWRPSPLRSSPWPPPSFWAGLASWSIGEPSDLLAAETTGPASLRGCSAEGRGKTLAFFPRPKRVKQNPEAVAEQRFRGGTP